MNTHTPDFVKCSLASNDWTYAGIAWRPPIVRRRSCIADLSIEALSSDFMIAEALRVQRGEIGRPGLLIMRNRLDAHILPLLGHLPACEFNTLDGQNLVDHLGGVGFSSTTISQYLVLLRKVIVHGVRTGALREVPEFPKIRVQSRPRGSFSASEYRAVVSTAYALRGLSHPMLERLAPAEGFWIARDLLVMPREMAWLIRLMVNSFIRPSDVKTMKHKHVEVVRGNYLYLRMRLPETKRHSQTTVSLRPAVEVYERLLAWRQHEGAASPNDYVFMPGLAQREHALSVLNFLFRWVLDVAGLSYGPQGQVRTLYCLRHTSITFRLLYGQGIDLLTLARNARTSVNMVERFYASALNGEMNVGMLQSKRVQPECTRVGRLT